jgi:GDP-4-dehydro-6-deoxy-D-mannose reductase
MRVLVTGAGGFIGSHLVDHLLARGDDVVAFGRRRLAPSRGLCSIEGEILDADFLERIIAENAPEEVYHLAAQSLPNVSWEQPGLTHRINVEGTLNVLGAVRKTGVGSRIVIASSSSIYAQNLGGEPIREDNPCRPASPYGVSKLAADHSARLQSERFGLNVVCARPFFIIGPRKTGDVCSDWARNIVAIERGDASELVVGNTDVVRDFLAVSDGVAAMIRIAEKGVSGESYNISSGVGWNLADVLETLVSMSKEKISTRVDPERVRPVDERIKIGDNRKLMALGWLPSSNVPEVLGEILNYWRRNV